MTIHTGVPDYVRRQQDLEAEVASLQDRLQYAEDRARAAEVAAYGYRQERDQEKANAARCVSLIRKQSAERGRVTWCSTCRARVSGADSRPI